MVIVIGVISFALPVMFSIIFLILQQQVRIYALQDIKRQGDNALSNMKSTILQYGSRIVDSGTTDDKCATIINSPSIYLIDKHDVRFNYYLTGDNRIASGGANFPVPLPLTTTKVTVSNLLFSCSQSNTFSPPVVSISFAVSIPALGTSMNYATKVKLRTY
jgi:type II secretory pathway pseudopilin PulG